MLAYSFIVGEGTLTRKLARGDVLLVDRKSPSMSKSLGVDALYGATPHFEQANIHINDHILLYKAITRNHH